MHVSTHVSLRQAIDLVTEERVVEAALLAAEVVRRAGTARPRIAVAGLNPHAGEGGLFGDEELRHIGPAVRRLRDIYQVDAHGPIPPDTVFARAAGGEFDAVIAMYHDQGHIAVKTLGLDSGVNVTVGLPFCRTSVDHGTAFDIAG
ncbi:MAG: 4-hydroxythreonine-4-phosphate dehydrogenase PdxA, partial [Dehalococcoidia bacterium]|nr:4-hydroxythreonine-4-phosphate dehydrogenase PdxA [Dehalococcoidia bacterium]